MAKKQLHPKCKRIQMRAVQIQRSAGKKTVTKQVYKMNLGTAMKKAAAEIGTYSRAVKGRKKKALSRKKK